MSSNEQRRSKRQSLDYHVQIEAIGGDGPLDCIIKDVSETGARILGVVLNRAQIEKHSYYYSHYYGHYYGKYHTETGRTRDVTNSRKKSGSGTAAMLLAAFLAAGTLGCEQLPEVPNVPPAASFFYSPVSPINAGQTNVAFNASASRDADGSIASYSWNFGDGSAEQTGGSINHVFPVVSRCVQVTYTVSLTVVDNVGEKGFANQAVAVINLPAPTSLECNPK